MSQRLPSFWSFLGVSLVLGVVGFGGLTALMYLTLPTIGPRWLFFFFLTIAASGGALPVMYFLNRRFPTQPPADSRIVMREAMWVGGYACLLAWLQMGRVLTSGLALVLALGLLLVEFLLRMGENSTWSPIRRAGEVEEAQEVDG